MKIEEIYRGLYYRECGQGRTLCICRACDFGPVTIITACVSSEPCDRCGEVAWRDLTEEEFASKAHLSLILLSKYLKSEMHSLYSGDESDESEEWRKVLKKLVENLEGFADERTAEWLKVNFEERRSRLEYLLDEFYTRDLLKKVPQMVERTLKWLPMLAAITPDPKVNIYLREATRAYITGHWTSSVVLSRSALEQGLKDRLKDMPIRPSSWELAPMLKWIGKNRMIDAAYKAMADKIQETGNEVVHRGSASAAQAQETLDNVRGVLENLYS